VPTPPAAPAVPGMPQGAPNAEGGPDDVPF